MAGDFSTIYNADNLAREKPGYQSIKERAPQSRNLNDYVPQYGCTYKRSFEAWNSGKVILQYYKGMK